MTILLILEILFLLLLLFLSIRALKSSQFMLFLFSSFTAFYMIVRPIMLLSDNYVNFAVLNSYIYTFDDKALIYEFLYILISYFIVFYSYRFFTQKRRDRLHLTSNKFDMPKIITGVLSALIVIIVDPVYGLPYLTYLFLFYNIKNNRSFIVVTILFILLFFMYTFSIDRRDWLFLILSIVFVYFSLSKNVHIVKISIVGIISLFLLSYLLLAFRTNGLFDYYAVYERLMTSDVILRIIEIEFDFPIVSDDVGILFESLLVSNTTDYLYGIPFLKPLYSIIPRMIWDDKPLTISLQFAEQFNPAFFHDGGSLPITIYGELFWNFWIFSFLVFVGFAYYYAYLDKKINNAVKVKDYNQIALVSVYIALNFHLLRGPIDNFWLAFLLLYALTVFEKIVRNVFKNHNRIVKEQ